jgi:DNA-binding GntR family transcriptional regulator
MSAALQFERDRAYRGRVDLIISGGVDADEALFEGKLADSLEVGRTPVREALRNLVRRPRSAAFLDGDGQRP